MRGPIEGYFSKDSGVDEFNSMTGQHFLFMLGRSLCVSASFVTTTGPEMRESLRTVQQRSQGTGLGCLSDKAASLERKMKQINKRREPRGVVVVE